LNIKTTYTCLNKQIFTDEVFSLVPIRWEDRYKIMQWRNEQIFHLRQNKILTVEEQNAYFENVISKLFDQEQPDQILFSMLQREMCIAYGGLVHIDWKDKNAEISFVMNTDLEASFFEYYWTIYLKFIQNIAFLQLKLFKIFIYAFDLRPHLYPVLIKNGFDLETKLKRHIKIGKQFKDVVIYTKYKTNE